MAVAAAEQARAGAPGSAAARPTCYRCFKPRRTCICAAVHRVPNRTAIWLVQHPRERFHPLGTARIASLGLDRMHLEVARSARDEPPASLPPSAGLLYPGPEARELASLLPIERPDVLVVIDGTWAQARALYRHSPWLRRLPRYRLVPARASRYRLRRQPTPSCLSTIEAIVQALRILEPATPDLDGLLDAFEAMIDKQLAIIAAQHRGRRGRRTPRSRHGLPCWSLRQPEALVAVAIEAAPPRGAARNAPAIVHCAAMRLGSRAVLQHFVRPPPGRFPTARHLEHMGLDAERLAGGTTARHFARAWSRFVRPDDVVVTWSDGVLRALQGTVELPARRLRLKSAYRSAAKQARGPLAALVSALHLTPRVVPPLTGRAGRHLADVVALLEHLAGGG